MFKYFSTININILQIIDVEILFTNIFPGLL